MKVTVYTLPTCPFCTRAKNFLDLECVDYEEIVLRTDEEKRVAKERSGMITAPMIYFDEECIGGYDDMMHKYSFAFFEIKDGVISWKEMN